MPKERRDAFEPVGAVAVLLGPDFEHVPVDNVNPAERNVDAN